jgi:hypothetical protein
MPSFLSGINFKDLHPSKTPKKLVFIGILSANGLTAIGLIRNNGGRGLLLVALEINLAVGNPSPQSLNGCQP